MSKPRAPKNLPVNPDPHKSWRVTIKPDRFDMQATKAWLTFDERSSQHFAAALRRAYVAGLRRSTVLINRLDPSWSEGRTAATLDAIDAEIARVKRRK